MLKNSKLNHWVNHNKSKIDFEHLNFSQTRKSILIMRSRGMKYKEIGELVGISTERARLLYNRSSERLKIEANFDRGFCTEQLNSNSQIIISKKNNSESLSALSNLEYKIKRKLMSSGLDSLAAISQYKKKELLSKRGFGPQTVNAIETLLLQNGLNFEQ